MRTQGQRCHEGKSQLCKPELRGSELPITSHILADRDTAAGGSALGWGEHRASPRSLTGSVLTGVGHGGCHRVSLTFHVIQVRGAQHLGLRLVSGHLLLWATQAAQGAAWAEPLPKVIAG